MEEPLAQRLEQIMPEIQDLLVNAPKAFQRKLVEGADKSTTHHAKTDQPLRAAFRFSCWVCSVGAEGARLPEDPVPNHTIKLRSNDKGLPEPLRGFCPGFDFTEGQMVIA